jgi:hypothetical protein
MWGCSRKKVTADLAQEELGPGEQQPHTERRQAEALRVWQLLQRGALQLPLAGA